VISVTRTDPGPDPGRWVRLIGAGCVGPFFFFFLVVDLLFVIAGPMVVRQALETAEKSKGASAFSSKESLLKDLEKTLKNSIPDIAGVTLEDSTGDDESPAEPGANAVE
ncbi:unnamed protein product, partial [Amoebophrya sp. A25]